MPTSKRELGMLKRIQRDLAQCFRYATDQEQHGRIDFWQGLDAVQAGLKRQDLRADCEEYAMAAVYLARTQGFDARLVVCRDETGAGHCLTEVVATGCEEAYYLDNRVDGLAVRDDLSGYRFVAVGPWNPVPGDTRPWHSAVL